MNDDELIKEGYIYAVPLNGIQLESNKHKLKTQSLVEQVHILAG